MRGEYDIAIGDGRFVGKQIVEMVENQQGWLPKGDLVKELSKGCDNAVQFSAWWKRVFIFETALSSTFETEAIDEFVVDQMLAPQSLAAFTNDRLLATARPTRDQHILQQVVHQRGFRAIDAQLQFENGKKTIDVAAQCAAINRGFVHVS